MSLRTDPVCAGVCQPRILSSSDATSGWLRILAPWLVALTVALSRLPAVAATLTVQTNSLGATPEVLGYNSGHFFPGSNTPDWWRYAGVKGVRVFISASEIEPSDDIVPVGDGVTDQASFIARRIALRADPLHPAFINWAAFSNRYETTDLYPNNHIRVNYALRELRALGVQVLAQITVSPSRFPIGGSNDWAGRWELWQHCYAQAFYLGRVFDVERYQMYNEPNHSSAGGLTIPDFLQRLQLASDAFQSALADVNRLDGKSLRPRILAPVTAGSADGAYPGWGEAVVTNRHQNVLGQADPGFWLIHQYDYHQYGTSPSGFGSDLASLRSLLAGAMAPEAHFPVSISEFNVHTGADFDAMPETLDTPAKYSRFGAIAVNLVENGIDELYAFKFSQTERAGAYPVQKNAMHYTDNITAPYPIGGITKAGEVFRLVAKAAAPGRDRLGVTASSSAADLDTLATFDPVTQCHHLLVVNDTTASVSLTANVAAWNLPTNNLALIEEVSETLYGGGRRLIQLGPARAVTDTLGPNSVWLYTVPAKPQQPEELIGATDDTTVKDGSNQAANFGGAPTLLVRNDPTNAGNRSVAFLKFRLPVMHRPDVQLAVLSLHASTVSASAPVQAHVFGLAATNWSAQTLTWNGAPNLKANVSPGGCITNGVVDGAGGSAQILGQLVVHAPTTAERLVDVTAFLRAATNADVSFLIAQEPRWNVALPSLAPGDTQPDGIHIIAAEGATPTAPAPRLRLVRLKDTDSDGLSDEAESALFGTDPNNADTDSDGISDGLEVLVYHTDPKSVPSVITNVTASARATVRGGASAASDVDEAAAGYVMVKHHAAPFDLARKGYLEFDLTGANPDTNAAATLTLTRFPNSGTHHVQLWALNQPYAGMTDALTWNAAQANETNSNRLRTNGAFTATALLDRLFPGGAGTDYLTLAGGSNGWGQFPVNCKLVLVLTGLENTNNNAAGYRVAVTNTVFQPALSFRPAPPFIQRITSGGGTVRIEFRAGDADPAAAFTLLRATNLGAGWLPLPVTTTPLGPGLFYVTDLLPERQSFYRVTLRD